MELSARKLMERYLSLEMKRARVSKPLKRKIVTGNWIRRKAITEKRIRRNATK